MADVFISYARTSSDKACAIAGALRAQGYSVWLDQDLPASRAYADVISEQLDEATSVLVLWSQDAVSSHWVRSEANRARERGALIQARLDDARLPMPFDQIQCLDLRRWRGRPPAPAWRALVAAIEELSGQVPAAADGTSPKRFEDRTRLGRRTLLVGGLAATGVAGWFGWSRLSRSKVEAPPEVRLLLQKATAIMQDSPAEDLPQSIAYLQEATRLEPRLAESWGLLAFAHALQRVQVPSAARSGEDGRSRSAARTALGLDKDEAFASCALALLVPPYRNWARSEVLARDLVRRFPFLPLTHNLLADLYADVGCWRDSVAAHAKVDRRRYLLPLSDRSAIQSLWSSGDLQGAENMLAAAVGRWPRHEAIWNLRIRFLTHTGRANEAVELLVNGAAHPAGLPEPLLSASLMTARAILGTADKAQAVADNLRLLESGNPNFLLYLNRSISMAQLVAQRCAALGGSDTAFAILNGYYFGRGRWARLAPEAGDDDRSTVNLFEPPMSSLWPDPRFAALVDEIGLERHWRATSRAPDYRSA